MVINKQTSPVIMSRFKIMVHQHAERLLHIFVYADIHIKRPQTLACDVYRNPSLEGTKIRIHTSYC